LINMVVGNLLNPNIIMMTVNKTEELLG